MIVLVSPKLVLLVLVLLIHGVLCDLFVDHNRENTWSTDGVYLSLDLNHHYPSSIIFNQPTMLETNAGVGALWTRLISGLFPRYDAVKVSMSLHLDIQLVEKLVSGITRLVVLRLSARWQSCTTSHSLLRFGSSSSKS